MAASNTSNIKFRAFTISQDLPINENIQLLEKVSEKYSRTIAKERLMKLSSAENDHENDIINNAIYGDNFIFCSLMRLDLDTNARNVPDAFLANKSFPFDSLQSEEAKSNIYKKHFYFCFNNKFLITNLPGNYTITIFQTYINWFLHSEERQYMFVPLVCSNNVAKLSDIKSVIFNSTNLSSNNTGKNIETPKETMYNKVVDLGIAYIKELVSDTISLSDKELQQVVSAKLLLNIKRPKLMPEEEYQRKFASIMKPIADGDNVQYELKNGKKIKSQDMAVTTTAKIELTDKGYPVEEQIKQEMIKFLNEVGK